MTMCGIQEWQLLLSYFLIYFTLIISDEFWPVDLFFMGPEGALGGIYKP